MDKSFEKAVIIELPESIDPHAWVLYEENEDDYDTCKKNVLDWLHNILDKWSDLKFLVKWQNGKSYDALFERYDLYEAIIKNLKGEVYVVDDRDKMIKEITFDPETIKLQIELRNGVVLTADGEGTPKLLKLLEGIEHGLIEIIKEENFAE